MTFISNSIIKNSWSSVKGYTVLIMLSTILIMLINSLRKKFIQNEYGIIALSIDKLLEIDYKLFQSISVNSISKKAVQESDAFIDKYSSVWNSFQNIHIIGIIVFFKFISDLHNDIIVSKLTSLISLLGLSQYQFTVFNDLKNIAAVLKD